MRSNLRDADRKPAYFSGTRAILCVCLVAFSAVAITAGHERLKQVAAEQFGPVLATVSCSFIGLSLGSMLVAIVRNLKIGSATAMRSNGAAIVWGVATFMLVCVSVWIAMISLQPQCVLAAMVTMYGAYITGWHLKLRHHHAATAGDHA